MDLNNEVPFLKVPTSDYYKIEKEKGVILRELKNSLKIRYKNIDIDLVKMHRVNEVETIRSFDMTVCAAAVSVEGVFMNNDFLLDLASKQIHFMSLHSPFSTLVRLQKYIKKGFSCSYDEMHKLAFEIKTMPIAEINPVEFQLDQLEQQYGVPKNVPRHSRTASDGTAGISLSIDQIPLHNPRQQFRSPGINYREIDNTIVEHTDDMRATRIPFEVQQQPSIIDRLVNAFTPAVKEEYENDGY